MMTSRLAMDHQQNYEQVGAALGDIVGSLVDKAIGGRGKAAAAGRLLGSGAGAAASAEAAAAAAGGAAAAEGAAAGSAAAAGGVAAGGTAATVAAIALPVAGVVAGLAAFAIALNKATEVANGLGDELENISPAIASTRAYNELARFQDQLERSAKLGGSVSQVEAAQGRLSQATYDLMTEIYAILAKGAPAIEVATDSITAILRAIIVLKESADLASPFATKEDLVELVDAIGKFKDSVGEIFKFDDEKKRKDADMALDDLMGLLNEGDRPKPALRPNRKPGRINLRQ